MKDEFDKEAEYLWMSDVFGYSWAQSQILKNRVLLCMPCLLIWIPVISLRFRLQQMALQMFMWFPASTVCCG
ncbi:MAG: hypothetical protein ACLRTF_00015 [Blautia sp.]